MNDMTTEYVAAFDAGTTALKGALVNGQGCIVASASSELDLIINGDYREQSPDQWWQAFCSASRHMIEQARQSESEFNVTRIRGIIFSGQMQDVIVLNGELNPVRNAILYSDGRAEEQAKQLAETYQGGAERAGNVRAHSSCIDQFQGLLDRPINWRMRGRCGGVFHSWGHEYP